MPTGSRSLKLKKKLSIIQHEHHWWRVFVQPGKRCPAAETKIDPVTMVRIKASTNLEQAIHKGEQAGPLADTLQIIVITDKINNKKRNTFLDNGLKSWPRTMFWNLILFLRGWESWWKDGSWPGETLTHQIVMAGLQFTFIIDEPHWYDGTPHGADGSVLTSKAGFSLTSPAVVNQNGPLETQLSVNYCQ